MSTMFSISMVCVMCSHSALSDYMSNTFASGFISMENSLWLSVVLRIAHCRCVIKFALFTLVGAELTKPLIRSTLAVRFAVFLCPTSWQLTATVVFLALWSITPQVSVDVHTNLFTSSLDSGDNSRVLVFSRHTSRTSDTRRSEERRVGK